MVFLVSDVDIDKGNPLYHREREANGIKELPRNNFFFNVKWSDSFSLIYIIFYTCILKTSAQAEAENQKALRQAVLPQLSWLKYNQKLRRKTSVQSCSVHGCQLCLCEPFCLSSAPLSTFHCSSSVLLVVSQS